MSEDTKKEMTDFMQALANAAQEKMNADAVLGHKLRLMFGGTLLAALNDPDPMQLLYFCARHLVGHTIAHSTGGTVITCTEFEFNGVPSGDWQVIITPWDQELSELAAENAGAKTDGTVH